MITCAVTKGIDANVKFRRNGENRCEIEGDESQDYWDTEIDSGCDASLASRKQV